MVLLAFYIAMNQWLTQYCASVYMGIHRCVKGFRVRCIRCGESQPRKGDVLLLCLSQKKSTLNQLAKDSVSHFLCF